MGPGALTARRAGANARGGQKIAPMSCDSDPAGANEAAYALLDPGTVLVAIDEPYDERFGNPHVHFFIVVRRDGPDVTIAGIAKAVLPETAGEREFRKRVRPLPDELVRSCATCTERAVAACRARGEEWSGCAAIDDARWFAYDGPGALHDAASAAFDHLFRDDIPTATLRAHVAGGEPYLRADVPARTMLRRVPEVDEISELGAAWAASWLP